MHDVPLCEVSNLNKLQIVKYQIIWAECKNWRNVCDVQIMGIKLFQVAQKIINFSCLNVKVFNNELWKSYSVNINFLQVVKTCRIF